jgi:hypothetical protein
MNDRISYWGSSMAVDSSGNTYVVGSSSSSDFPTLNAFQGTHSGSLLDTVVTKLDSSGSSLIYSTYLGGSDNEWGNGIAIDAAGNAYVTGHTWSPDFPTLNAFQGTYTTGFEEAYITKLSDSVITVTPTVSPTPTVSGTPLPVPTGPPAKSLCILLIIISIIGIRNFKY